ncbi:MAG: sigma-54-dependent Fis family transcriptional regulator, partial [Acidobacteria bacterium]
SWPGNVRELRNVIERAMILNAEGSLSSLDLSPAQGLASAALGGSSPEGTAQTSELNLRAALGLREKEIVLAALRRSGGVRKEAALLLGIDQRNLGYYLRKHGIDPERL